jgi:hypothetical protein
MYIGPYLPAGIRVLWSMFISLPIELWCRTIGRLMPSYTWANYTSVPDITLVSCWLKAQQNIAAGNWSTTAGGGAGHPMPQALLMTPTNVAVIPVPDWSIADLMKYDSNWKTTDKEPTGTFGLLSGLSYTSCHACTLPWARPRVYAAVSQIPAVLTYEFENIILSRLGVDVSGR